MTVEKAFQTQLRNIQSRTGKTLEELYAFIRESGLTRHGEIRDMLKRNLGMGHGDANTLTQFYMRSIAGPPAPGAVAVGENAVDEIYAGPKAALRPIHDRLMAAIARFGPFEAAPKKGYISLRRRKQFAMIGPATKSRVEVGLNMKGVTATPRLTELPPGGMCQYRVYVTDANEVDEELIGWIRQAYDGAG
jgi:hypothetical protein